MSIQKLPCRTCGVPTEAYPINGTYISPLCDNCQTREFEQSGMAAMAEVVRERRKRIWESITPPAYRETVFEKLPCPEISKRVLAWTYGPKGLVLWGPTRRGKSRTAYLLLQQHYHAGRSVAAYDCIRFAEECERHKYGTKAAEWMKALACVDILLVDDFDKDRLAPHQEGKLFGLIDRRCVHQRPTIFTLNAEKNWSTAFRHGKELVARMREFNRHVRF